MYIRDFNPNNYNDDIWMSDLCINTNKILTYLPLIDVKFVDGIIGKYLFVYYDISQTSIKKFCYFKYLTEQEPNLIGSRILYQNSKQVFELKFNIPRYFFIIVSSLASRSIYVQLLNFYIVRIHCGMGIVS